MESRENNIKRNKIKNKWNQKKIIRTPKTKEDEEEEEGRTKMKTRKMTYFKSGSVGERWGISKSNNQIRKRRKSKMKA